MSTYTDRADVFGTIVWTAPMQTAKDAESIAKWIKKIASKEPNFRQFACRLAIRGANLVLCPDFHGDKDAWKMVVKPDTWLSANIEKINLLKMRKSPKTTL